MFALKPRNQYSICLVVKYERIKFLVIALKDGIEIYAWAPQPYHKFMAFKSFPDLLHKPMLVDMTIEEGTRFKVIYGSTEGFHAVDLDFDSVYDIYVPSHVSANKLSLLCRGSSSGVMHLCIALHDQQGKCDNNDMSGPY